MSNVGGASETDETAVAVAPALPPGPAVVMTWTAAPSRLIAFAEERRLDRADGLGPHRRKGAVHGIVGTLVDPAHDAHSAARLRDAKP